MDIAVVGAGVNLTLDDKGVCSQARVSLGAVAERALLVPEAAAALIGTKVDAAALAAPGRRRQRGLPADRRQARHQGIPHQGRRRDGAARRRNCARHGQGGRTDGQASCDDDAQRQRRRVSVRNAADAARSAARRTAPHRHQGRLRHRRLRRLQRHRRRAPGVLLPGARRRSAGQVDRNHRRHGRRARTCIRCSASSSSTRRCSAASARRGS